MVGRMIAVCRFTVAYMYSLFLYIQQKFKFWLPQIRGTIPNPHQQPYTKTKLHKKTYKKIDHFLYVPFGRSQS